MLKDAIYVIWIFLPAGLANMAPIFAAHWHILPGLNKPLDFGKTFRNKRLLGDHKTIRGFVVGWFSAVTLVLIQAVLYENINFFQYNSQFVNYHNLSLLAWGTALSLGALGGDAIKSFFKRQINIDPGKSWVPFDQIDYVIGTLIASRLVLSLPLRFYILATIIGLIAHPISTFIGWFLKLKNDPI
jgi:CDP-2,3-bis-(O-geranylgeranyl)-sn-glycerol synthase